VDLLDAVGRGFILGDFARLRRARAGKAQP